MRNRTTTMGWVIMLGCTLAAPAAALDAPGAGDLGGCPGGSARRSGRVGAGPAAFEQGAVTTIQARVVEVQRVARGRREGVHLAVVMGAETVEVHLGPAFYVDAQAVRLAPGDVIEVRGARTLLQGTPVIVAQEVRRGDDVLALRDGSGVPLWRGQGMARR